MEPEPPFDRHVIVELGLEVATDGEVVLGRAPVVENLCVPGTDELRTSVVLTWADVLAGAVSGRAMEPRIPLTLDLEVQLVRPARPGEVVTAEARSVRAGRTVAISEAWFRDEASGEPVAVAVATFVPAPDPTHVFPDGFPMPDMAQRPLTTPLGDRLGCTVVAPGRVEMPRRDDALNAVGAMQGGLASLAIEDAVGSLQERPGALRSLTVRYLRPVMHGPALADAVQAGDAFTARLTDAGTGTLCLLATARRA
jgi:acyl-coenzyme A thioesterase PaaI-like protein